MVRCRVATVSNANPDKPWFIGRPIPMVAACFWWRAALDHGVVHDIGDSAFEPIASIKWVPATYGYPFRATDVWGWPLTQGGARRLRRVALPWANLFCPFGAGRFLDVWPVSAGRGRYVWGMAILRGMVATSALDPSGAIVLTPRRATTRPRTGRAHDHCEKPIGASHFRLSCGDSRTQRLLRWRPTGHPEGHFLFADYFSVKSDWLSSCGWTSVVNVDCVLNRAGINCSRGLAFITGSAWLPSRVAKISTRFFPAVARTS